jgi:uncharacterized protein (TIGR02270 family)
MTSPRVKQYIGFKPEEISALYNMDVITQHAEESAFLWILRDGTVLAPNYSLKDLVDLDERLEANLDGLRVARDKGWEVCEEELIFEEGGEVFTAAVLAFESKNSERIQKLLDIGSSEPELERSLISALGWIALDHAEGIIKKLLSSESSEIRRIGIAAYAIHRKDPGPPLIEAISDSDIRVRARAIKATGELGRHDLIPQILYKIQEENEECRFYAAWSAARLGNRTSPVFSALKEIAEAESSYSERALDIALRCMTIREAKDWYQHLKGKPEKTRLVAIGAGVIGIPDMIGDLIKLMEAEDVARIAGEAFSMITGVDLAYEDLDGDQPENFKTGPKEEEEDEEIALDPDEDLPWPAPDLVHKWWNQNKRKFQSGKRYLMGKEITSESLKDALVHGNQRQRAAAALELALLEPTKPLFETRAPGKKQLKTLMSWTS